MEPTPKPRRWRSAAMLHILIIIHGRIIAKESGIEKKNPFNWLELLKNDLIFPLNLSLQLILTLLPSFSPQPLQLQMAAWSTWAHINHSVFRTLRAVRWLSTKCTAAQSGKLCSNPFQDFHSLHNEEVPLVSLGFKMGVIQIFVLVVPHHWHLLG